MYSACCLPALYICVKFRENIMNGVLITERTRIHSRNCLFVLRFYGPVNPMGSFRARSVYLTTRLLGRLSPLSG